MTDEAGLTLPWAEDEEFLAVQLRSSVVFPGDVVSVQLSAEEASPLLSARGADADRRVACVFGRRAKGQIRRLADVHQHCVVCRVVQCLEIPRGGVQAVLQGLGRGVVLELERRGEAAFLRVGPPLQEKPDTVETDPEFLDLLDLLSSHVTREAGYPDDLESVLRLNTARGVGPFTDLAAAYLNLPLAVKRDLAVCADARTRLAILAGALREEVRRGSVDADVQKRVRDQMEERQREHYLRQQLRAIRRELGEEGGAEEEPSELFAALKRARLPKEAKAVAEREIRRLASVPSSSAEYQVIRSYVGWLLDLPWRKRSRKAVEIADARRVLDERHACLDRVKERIFEHLAVRSLRKDKRGPILCLVGPPGVGKTTLGRAVARALGRKFVRMSVGGLRDEAEIKGHRRTYVGAMPGKILQLLRNAGARNPVLQIDEIDKMGADARGDPASALLEVLDPEVNTEFRDHYLDVPFDLSEVFFLVTANLADPIPPALRDRLEILRIEGYTPREKIEIAERHLVPRALEESGLSSAQLRIPRTGIEAVLDGYTREAGLRQLERGLSRICRKVAARVVSGRKSKIVADAARVHALLGPRRYAPDLAGRKAQIGVATGLAWTAYGGTLLFIEALRMPGDGKLVVTGQLGSVMQESARAALSYVRANADALGLDPREFGRFDVHVHMPEGATPKDGPSAGVAIAVCLASLFLERPVREDLAMTGEITLKGRVLEVGGVKEKLLAAYRAGIRSVCIPKANLKDLEELPAEVRRGLDVTATEDAMENISEALLALPSPTPRRAPSKRPVSSEPATPGAAEATL